MSEFFLTTQQKRLLPRVFFLNHSETVIKSLTGCAGDENSSCKFLSWILVDKSGSHLFFDLLLLMVQKSQTTNYLGWC